MTVFIYKISDIDESKIGVMKLKCEAKVTQIYAKVYEYQNIKLKMLLRTIIILLMK